MADWSQLPPELLSLITKRLETRLAVLRFRSVCSSWRSSIPPKLYPLPKFLPSKTKGRCEYSLSHITRNTTYLVRLPENQTSDPGCCWLVKIRDGTDRVGMRLLNPLSDSELKPLPLNFPKVLDLTSFQVIELGHEFVARHDVYMDHPLEPQSRDYRSKVALMWSDNGDFIMLALFRSSVEHLAFLRSGEKDWTLLEYVDHVQDIISFNGKFYAIHQDGRTLVIDQSLNVNSLEQFQFGSRNSRKFLVQSDDNLLAIEMIYLTSSDSYAHIPVFSRFAGGDSVFGFRIFRLDEEEKKWHEIESLGDKVLLLGLRQGISVSASELAWGKGNLIFYSIGVDRVMFVFDLENNNASRFENFPACFNLFWPPPKWVIPSTLPQEVESKASDLVVSSSPESLTSSRETMSNSTSEISTRKLGGECNERRPSAGQKMGSKRPSQSSKFSFKFCCS